MKITQLFKIYWPDNGGGIAKVIESIADGFSDCEQEIIVCQDRRQKKSMDDRYKGIPVRRSRQLFTFASTPVSLRFLADVKKRTKDSDIVIYHFPYPMADLAVLFGLYSGKLVVWWHCGIEKYRKLMPFYRPLVRQTLKRADRILVSSKGNLAHSPVLAPFKSKCSVIPFSVSDEYLRRGSEYVKKNHRENAYIQILFIGRLVWYKGCDVLLKAFARMKQKNCRLTLIGGGPLENELKELASRLKLQNVEFAGMVPEEEKIHHIEACDFLVLPSVSKAEAFGLVQIEAMAFAKPVINTSLPSGVPFVSRDRVTGRTVKPKHVAQLAGAMDELAGNRELRMQYGKNAWERVNRQYTKQVMIRRYRKVFQKLLSSPVGSEGMADGSAPGKSSRGRKNCGNGRVQWPE